MKSPVAYSLTEKRWISQLRQTWLTSVGSVVVDTRMGGELGGEAERAVSKYNEAREAGCTPALTRSVRCSIQSRMGRP